MTSNNFEVQITTRFYVRLTQIKPLNGKQALKKIPATIQRPNDTLYKWNKNDIKPINVELKN